MTHAHSGGAGPSGAAALGNPAGLAAKLRAGTQDLHERVESQAFQQDFASGRISRGQYGAYLKQLLHVYGALEPVLPSLSTHAVLRGLLADYGFRYDLIRRDLVDLGVGEEGEVLAATRGFVEFIEQAGSGDAAALVGVLYVNEGATNGNKIIVKRVRETLGLKEDQASRYLDPYGADQRRHWMAFRALLDDAVMTEEEKGSAVAGARRTFEFFAELSEGLAVVKAG